MAFMSQEKKARIQAQLKKVIPSDWKWSLGVRHHSTIVLNIYAAPVDLVEAYTSKRCSEEVRASCLSSMHVDVNQYHWQYHFDGKLLKTFTAIFSALNMDNHDRSDLMTDYFDVGHYVDVNIGKLDKPFFCTAQQKQAA